ncbi:YybH family protein [Bremerella cremea]|nr:SgcJ/EcaC family oxidoreductase [Bremerella cremea]
MKNIGYGLLLTFVLTGTAWSQEAEQTSPAKPASEEVVSDEVALNEDEIAIFQAIDSYTAAFNKGDAQALADHWTDDGEYVSPDGKVLKGKDALVKDYLSYFQETPGAKLEVRDTHVKMISPRVATETGVAVVMVADQDPSETTYEAIHVKTPAGWRIDSIKEVVAPLPAPTHYQQLQGLEWMIGTWVDNAEENASVETTGRWTTNRNFLVRTFRVFIQDQVDFEGTQVIGWDPSLGVIRSWTFDSDGGFAAGRWSQSGNRWTVQSLSILPDGRQASSTNIYDLIDENTVEFHSIGRQVAGELLPNIETLTIIRSE